MDWACSWNRETVIVNRTLVGKPFEMNHTEISYEDLSWIEVAEDLVLALLLRFLSFLSRRSVSHFTYVLTSPHKTESIYCIPILPLSQNGGK